MEPLTTAQSRLSVLRPRNLVIVLVAAALAGLGYVCYMAWWYAPDSQDTVLLGQTDIFAEAPLGLRVLVRDFRTGKPVQGANVTLKLKGENGGAKLGRFVTDRHGTLSKPIIVPDLPPGDYRLTVSTRSRLGRDEIVRDVTLAKPARLYLTTDKPVYQPGQTIHMRAMLLNTATMQPAAEAALAFEVQDPKGNMVCRQQTITSKFGIASADFDLADRINMGRYRVTAASGPNEAEKSVAVEDYVLPRFRLQLDTDEPFYLPGQKVSGSLSAGYFFGKPVAQAHVEIVGRTAAEPVGELFRVDARTDEEGVARFEARLPDALTGLPLAAGNAVLDLEAEVTDSAGHTESTLRRLFVAEEPLRVDVVPEGGRLVAGIENRLYILTSYPDGRPAQCDLEVGRMRTVTDESGVAVVTLRPSRPALDVTVVATDTAGRRITHHEELGSPSPGVEFILRTDKAVYRAGERLTATVVSERDGLFFLDVVRNGQTALTQALDVAGGRGVLTFDLPPGMVGALRLAAYTITDAGESVAATRIAYVQPASGLTVTATADRSQYRPGEEAKVRFTVSDPAGRPAPSALGISIVDEAVFHVLEDRPGLLDQFMAADEEMLRPAFQTKFFASPARLLRAASANQTLGKALFSAAARPSDSLNLQELVAGGYLAPDAAEDIRLGLASGRYDYFLEHEDEYGHLTEALKRRGLHTLQAATHYAKQAEAQSLREKYQQVLRHGGIALGAAGIGLVPFLLILLCVACDWPPTSYLGTPRRTAYGAATGLVHSSWMAIACPFAAYVAGALLATHLDGNTRLDFSVRGVLLGVLAFDLLLVVATIAYQRRLARRLARFPNAKVLTRQSMEVPRWLAGHFVLSRIAGLLAMLAGSGEAAVVVLVMSACFYVPVLSMASSVSRSIRTAFRVRPPAAGGCYAWLLLGGLALPLAFMLMPALARAREEARRAGASADLHNVHLAMAMARKDLGSAGGETAGRRMPRIREHFPETLLWEPQLITDDRGQARLTVPLADSITSWRMAVDAVSAGGALGATEQGISVFQDFFVEPDLPVFLTRGDEVTVPVTCYNYLEEPQRVEVTAETGAGIELLGPGVQSVELAPEEVRSLHFRLAARDAGDRPITFTAIGSHMSDAVRRTVRVRPDGRPHEKTRSGLLSGPVTHTFLVPGNAVPHASSLLLKLHPSRFSEVVEGLENVFRKPFGCFEQTSSCTYPNVMALTYMRETGQATPGVEVQARKFINAGYQRLLTFEVDGGGFEWFGHPPANIILTAYGILEFTDMAAVHAVDAAVIDRARRWLAGRQSRDGSWHEGRGAHTWGEVRGPQAVTAYVAWALAESGSRTPEVYRALDFLVRQEDRLQDPYLAALAANALLAADGTDPAGRRLTARLAESFTVETDTAYMGAGGMGVMYSRGACLDIDTTALAVLALLKSGQRPDLVRKALNWLSGAKHGDGTWGSTQSTILAMKALLEGTGSALGGPVNCITHVSLNGQSAGRMSITPQSSDLMQVLDLSDRLRPGLNEIHIVPRPGTDLPYQIVGTNWLPWGDDGAQAEPGLSIDVQYDRRTLKVGERVTVRVSVTNNAGADVPMAIIDLGIPPGFTVDTAGLAALVASGRAAKYELTGNQIILYARGLQARRPLSFSYELVPKYPIRAAVPSSRVYEYYCPENEAVAAPQRLTVNDR